MRDDFGDKIEVERVYDAVSVRFTVDGKNTGMILSAKKARKLIRKLQEQASAIEIAERGMFG